MIALIDRLLVVAGAIFFTAVFFLVLPIIQTLTKPASADLIVQSIDTATLEPPPPPPDEPQEEEEPEEEPEPPKLSEEAPPLDLSQLELALNPGAGGAGSFAGDFAINIASATSVKKDEVDSLFSIADLDQKPRAVFQPGPRVTPEMRKRAPGSVSIIFIVDQDGRVTDPIVQKSTDPIFEKAAVDAVKQWKFEPGKRNGQAVRFRMRVPITFPEGL